MLTFSPVYRSETLQAGAGLHYTVQPEVKDPFSFQRPGGPCRPSQSRGEYSTNRETALTPPGKR